MSDDAKFLDALEVGLTQLIEFTPNQLAELNKLSPTLDHQIDATIALAVELLHPEDETQS